MPSEWKSIVEKKKKKKNSNVLRNWSSFFFFFSRTEVKWIYSDQIFKNISPFCRNAQGITRDASKNGDAIIMTRMNFSRLQTESEFGKFVKCTIYIGKWDAEIESEISDFYENFFSAGLWKSGLNYPKINEVFFFF